LCIYGAGIGDVRYNASKEVKLIELILSKLGIADYLTQCFYSSSSINFSDMFVVT